MASFKEAFAKARKELGAGKTFTWNGKSYTTDYAEEAGKKAAPKPKARPASVEAKGEAGARELKAKTEMAKKASMKEALKATSGTAKPATASVSASAKMNVGPGAKAASVAESRKSMTEAERRADRRAKDAAATAARTAARKKPEESAKLKRLREELAMQKQRSAVRSGMTLRERNGS